MLIHNIYLEIGVMVGVKATPVFTSPFFHVPLDPGGLTILVCVVSDVLHRDTGINWLSRGSRPTIYNVLGDEDGSQNRVSGRPWDSSELETYTCFISQKSTVHFMQRHYTATERTKTGK